MFCPYCGRSFHVLPNVCDSCGKSLTLLKNMGQEEDIGGQNTASATASNMPSLATFLHYRKNKSEERQTFFCHKKNPKKKENKKVQINIGIMSQHNDLLKPVRGKTLPLLVDPQIDATALHLLAVKKMTDFNTHLEDGPYTLIYPDVTEVVNIPGSPKPFNLKEYKSELGKPYNRITLYICLKTDFDNYHQPDASDEDSEVHVKSRSTAEFEHAETLVNAPWEPDHMSTPNTSEALHQGSRREAEEILISDNEGGLEGTSEACWMKAASSAVEACSSTATAPTNESNFYRTYTKLYAPVVIEDDDDESEYLCEVPINDHTEKSEDTNVLVADIIQELAASIDHKTVNRFNITRSNVWDGGVRGFRRSTFSETSDLQVRFTDDEGVTEEGLDTGGPKREFLTLLMGYLQCRPIFEGPTQRRYLVYNSTAIREDEYFLAGKMIAVSIVHGGPGPHFLSMDLVNHIVGQPGFSANVKDVTDGEIGKALLEIESAQTLNHVQDVVLKHSSLLQTAGCLRRVNSVEDGHSIVSEYLKWFILDRNQTVIQRFKDDLATLQFLEALCQHPTVLAPVLCHNNDKLTAQQVEQLFKPQLSPVGSTSRNQENMILSFWADYIMDCEEKGNVTLEELLMFATGLKSIPPAGMTPQPCVTFSHDSVFPIANTCANTIRLPLLPTYAVFKANMDFGVQNSPGFGCF